MDREVSLAVEIGVALTVIAAVIGIFWFTVYMGEDMSNNATIEATGIISDVEVGALDDLCYNENVMPLSAIYNVLRTYSDYIPSYTCHLCEDSSGKPTQKNLMVDNPCILEHMRGKSSLQIIKTDEGWYHVAIHNMTCDWHSKDNDGLEKCTYCAGKR